MLKENETINKNLHICVCVENLRPEKGLRRGVMSTLSFKIRLQYLFKRTIKWLIPGQGHRG